MKKQFATFQILILGLAIHSIGGLEDLNVTTDKGKEKETTQTSPPNSQVGEDESTITMETSTSPTAPTTLTPTTTTTTTTPTTTTTTSTPTTTASTTSTTTTTTPTTTTSTATSSTPTTTSTTTTVPTTSTATIPTATKPTTSTDTSTDGSTDGSTDFSSSANSQEALEPIPTTTERTPGAMAWYWVAFIVGGFIAGGFAIIGGVKARQKCKSRKYRKNNFTQSPASLYISRSTVRRPEEL